MTVMKFDPKTQDKKESSKLTPEELTEFKQITENYQKSMYDLGVVVTNIDILKSQKNDLLDYIKDVLNKQQQMSNKLGDKYGGKQVNLETGELT